MIDIHVIWDEDDDPDGNVSHILEGHEITLDEVEEILHSPFAMTAESRSSGRPIPALLGWVAKRQEALPLTHNPGKG